MELSFFTMIPCTILFIISLSFLIYKHKSDASYTKNLPPGNTGLPVIGESLEILWTGRKGYPEKFIYYRMAKLSSKVFKTSLLCQPTAVFCGAAGNKFLFSNENKLVTAWWPDSVNKIFPSSTQTSSQEESKKMRKLLPMFLKLEALQRYIEIMDVDAERHLERDWDNKLAVIVFPLGKMYTFGLACCLFLGIEDPEEVEKYAEPFNALVVGILSIPIDFPGTPFNRGIKASNVMRKELLKIIKQRRIHIVENKGSLSQDILSHMLTTADDNGHYMNEMDIADKILGLLISGHDTASAAITFVVKYLAELPEVYNKVLEGQNEIAKAKAPRETLNWEDIQKLKYSWNIACEVMRLSPPLHGAFREATIDFNYSGVTIPKG